MRQPILTEKSIGLLSCCRIPQEKNTCAAGPVTRCPRRALTVCNFILVPISTVFREMVVLQEKSFSLESCKLGIYGVRSMALGSARIARVTSSCQENAL